MARAYLLYGILRSLRGDMVHYFKYRRVCMTHIYMLDGQDENIDALLAAISFHDAWAYMMYNATEEALPDIDQVLPPINTKANAAASTNTATSNEAPPRSSFGCRQVTNPINQMWIQGEPSIFLKNDATIVHRSLDAMSCAVRSCCDQANSEFSEMAKAMGGGGEGGDGSPSGDLQCGATPTSLAVMANEDEMCSRNLILSAKTLVNQGNTGERVSKPGLTMMLTAMDAFLENNDPQGSSESDGGEGGGGGGGGEEGGFSETQIRNLLMSCEMAIKHPMLLYAPGPVYHMMTNAAVLLCHLLNGLHAKCSMMGGDSSNGEEGSNVKAESAMFYETLDTFMSLRKLLNMRRQHLPVRLRCHAIPRPNFGLSKKNTELEAPFIDLGETLMCSCRGCQGFVLMGCSPCVAAERSMRSAKIQASELEGDDINEYDDLGELNLDDDTLLNILSRIASN